jgi:hypothetical protein
MADLHGAAAAKGRGAVDVPSASVDLGEARFRVAISGKKLHGRVPPVAPAAMREWRGCRTLAVFTRHR